MSLDSSLSVRDSGSNYPFNSKIDKPSVPRSVFDLSYINSFTCDEGQIVPFYTQYTLPNEDYNIDLECICRVVNPPVVPLLSRQRIFFHLYWCSFSQLWKNAQVFFDQGRLSMSSETFVIPRFSVSSEFQRSSLADYLGFGFGSSTVPSLKFMMYLKIWRDYYCNKRLFSAWLKSEVSKGNTDYKILGDFIFPLDDDDFRIGSSAWNVFINNDTCKEFFVSLKYRDFVDDYFTTAQITPLYTDDVPSINYSFENLSFFARDFSSQFKPDSPSSYNFGSPTFFSALHRIAGSSTPHYSSFLSPTNYAYTDTGSTYDHLRSWKDDIIDSSGNTLNPISSLNASIGITDSGSGFAISVDDFRNIVSETRILEKMARTDGTYKEYMLTMFGNVPKSANDMRPVFVGGNYQPIIYTQVVSTQGYIQNETQKPQGNLSGLGISSASDRLANFHSDDYGLFMGVLSVMPDTYYCQGWQREDLYRTSDDFYLPERAGLGLQPIFVSELFKSSDNDQKVFGYQNRYDELRYRSNEVHGKIADNSNESFSPYIQTRNFSSLPTLSPSFVTTENNISKKWLSSSEEVPYILQIANKVRAVRPVPYQAVPSSFGM